MTGSLCQIEGGVDECEYIGDIKEESNKAGHSVHYEICTTKCDKFQICQLEAQLNVVEEWTPHLTIYVTSTIFQGRNNSDAIMPGLVRI